MKLLVDNQLPTALARWLASQGEDAVHLLDLAQGGATDTAVWKLAAAEKRVVVSKDEDFFHLANRPGDKGRLLWVRMGNCRREALITRFAATWPGIKAAFASGQRIIELR